ncbi:MAG: hypothetical protein JWP11_1334 [Frankiales bacterium]|nr:hypothetical protein [Frankiales bacterium]
MTVIAKLTAIISATRHALVVLGAIGADLLAQDLVPKADVHYVQLAVALCAVIGVHAVTAKPADVPVAGPVEVPVPTGTEVPAVDTSEVLPDVATAPVDDVPPTDLAA